MASLVAQEVPATVSYGTQAAQGVGVKILCFGGTGLLGRATVSILRKSGHDVHVVGCRPGFYLSVDIRRDEEVSRVVRQIGPEAIVNCAAYANADKAEDDPVTAHAVNELGAWSVARAAKACGARLVHISTNFVYPDIGPANPTHAVWMAEDAEPAALGVYACSKLYGDCQVLNELPNALVLRIQSLYGPGGRNYVSTVPRLILEGTSPKLDPDRIVAPTSALAVARVISALLGDERASQPTGVVHFQCAGQTTWAEWGREMCRALQRVDMVQEFSPPYRAPRPRVLLACDRLLAAGYVIPTWQEAVAEVARMEHLERLA